MSRLWALCALAVLVGILAVTPAFAHGVLANTISSKAAVVQFCYVGGEPMSYAEVAVYSPNTQEGDVEFQNGRTDAKGNFAFVPDRVGVWRITASDMGHKAELQITVADEGITQAQAAAGISSLPLRVALGLSLILNLLAGCFWVKRSSRKKQST